MINSIFSMLKDGISTVYNFFESFLNAVTDVGIYILISLLAISLVWRYILSPFFK